ncbi:MAG: ribulose bisphosphate carboxylase small subunit [Gammaproteobacteria bacterium]|nr:ribulose bisphosphate carboxylase small subunit [Gammaproteobacteria bacterium]
MGIDDQVDEEKKGMQMASKTATDSVDVNRALGKIGQCLRKGCFICIEHTSSMAPRFSPWQVWGQAQCFDGDTDQIVTEISLCREAHVDHHIRLNINDYSCHSRFSAVVHSPAARKD